MIKGSVSGTRRIKDAESLESVGRLIDPLLHDRVDGGLPDRLHGSHRELRVSQGRSLRIHCWGVGRA